MLNRWAAVAVAFAMVGSLSACGGSSGPSAAGGGQAMDGAPMPAQGGDTTSTPEVHMTVSGDVTADLTTANLATGFYCGDFQGETFEGSPTAIDFYSVNFDFTVDGAPWSLLIDITSGGPGTLTVGDYNFNVLFGPTGAGHGDVYEVWEGQDAVSSGTVTVAEDGQSGSLDVQNLVKLGADSSAPGVNIQGDWSC